MLYTPPSQFQFEYDDTTAGSANFTTVATGILCTSNASVNVKGSYAQIVSATDRDWYGFWLKSARSATTSLSNTAALLDIAIGGAGSEVVILANFLCGMQFPITSMTFGCNEAVYVPLFIPKGSRISCRNQCATAAQGMRLYVVGQSGASLPYPVFSGCDTYGANTGASTGVALSSNASADTFGSWTSVGSATSRGYKAILISHQGFATTTANARSFVIEGGYSSAALIRLAAFSTATELWAAPINAQAVYQNIPAGTQLQARIACATASNTDTPSVAFHCFY